jgi:hypothetical protein
MHGKSGEQVFEYRLSTAGKTLSICTLNLINPPDNSTGLFLFNGVPRGAFLAQSILWRSGDPVTGRVHDLVFEMGNQKKWGIPVGCLISGIPVVMHD